MANRCRGGRRALAASPAVLATDKWTAVGHHLGIVFGAWCRRNKRTLIGHLGPGLLGETVDVDEALRRWAARGATPVAEVLLDQTVVAAGSARSRRRVAVRRAPVAVDARQRDPNPSSCAVDRRQLQRAVAEGQLLRRARAAAPAVPPLLGRRE